MESITLLALAVTIALSFWRKINAGVLAMGLAFVIGVYLMGLKPREIIGGFPTNLFITMFGITSIFCVARVNGTLQATVGVMTQVAGHRRKLLPLFFLFASFVLSALGPGTPPAPAIMFPVALAFADSENIDDLLMIMMVGCGSLGGSMSPLASSGVVGKTLLAEIGSDNYMPVFLSLAVTALAIGVVSYFLLKGHKLEDRKVTMKSKNTALDSKQLLTVAVIAVVLCCIGFLKTDVGLTALAGTAVLLLFNAADEKATLQSCPWNVYIMVGGVSVLISIVNKSGGIDMLSNFFTEVMSTATAASFMAAMGALLSSVASAVSVAMPTLIPTIPGIIEKLGGDLSPTMLTSAVVTGAMMVTFSPFSTLGGLAMASANARTDKIKLFSQLLMIAIGLALITMVLCFVGLYAIF